MREAGLWRLDPPSYYAPSDGLLSYEPDFNPDLTADFTPTARNMRLGDPVVARHFRLVNHQLLQLRTALALATMLNRTLVLPRFLCGVETVTNFAHRGIRCLGTSGCALELPYWCPADHVLRMHYWRGVMPQVPKIQIRYREFSMLHTAAQRHHAALDAVAPSATLRVSVAGDHGAARACDACPADGYAPRPDGGANPILMPRALAAKASHELKLPAGELSEEEMLGRLAPHASRGLIHFESLRPEAVRVALAPHRADGFRETILPLGGGFCCVEAERRGGFGHFWYDLLWDVPHTDRWGRRWSPDQKPWVPTPGP